MSESGVKVINLKPGMENIAVVVRVLEALGTRTIETKAGIRTLGEYIVGDETGRVKLVVWGAKAGSLNSGDVVAIKNAWVSTFKGEVQLNVGKNSSMERISDDAVVQADEIPNDTPKAEGVGRPQYRRTSGSGRGRGRRFR